MNKTIKKVLLLLIAVLPIMVLAKSDSEIPIGAALFFEAFVTIHMSVFVIRPFALLFSGGDVQKSKKFFFMMFFARILFLLYMDFFVTPMVFVFDFIFEFIGATAASIIQAVTKKNIMGGSANLTGNNPTYVSGSGATTVKGIELKCAKCGTPVVITDKFCPKCGVPMEGDNIQVVQNPNGVVNGPAIEKVSPANFDGIYNLPENQMLEEFLKREMKKAGIDEKTKLIPSDILKRKKIFNIIFSILLFVYISMIFFHFPTSAYFVGFLVLLIFFIATRRYKILKYLVKQLKARPQEKITNIVMNVKNTFVVDNSKGVFFISFVAAIVLPLIIFMNPRIIYEKMDNGYGVRYYIYGVRNYKTATIPETYKGEKVVSLRGNTFSNMYFLESVTLPNTLTEIRGQAFMNCINLVEVNIPTSLEYLGGGAFYNAIRIKTIELPDTLTYLGGEAFYGAESLEYVKLSENLTEIRGDTFEYCYSLKSITIPDNVTRIGGHAFYGDSNLSEVKFSMHSKLEEIGSSAFRQCDSLRTISIPNDTYVNERAFKESPTEVLRFTPQR